MGKLIAIEGTDSSGKETQSKLIYKKLTERGIKARLISFPAYSEPSSALVKMYLAGEFGKNAADVNAYAASLFYAADRFATFRRDWGRDYNDGVVIIADRYVPSNMIHQASKLEGGEEKHSFIEWLTDLEYGKLGLPVPDAVIFLDMPTEAAAELMRCRENKIDKSDKKDIHERDISYLKKSHDNAEHIARLRGWHRIPCADARAVRPVDEINADVMRIVDKITATI